MSLGGRRTLTRQWLAAVLVASSLSILVTPDAVAAIDPAAIGWRITWVATRDGGEQRVRVRIVFLNGSATQRFRGDCRVKVWNADDAARRVFRVRLAPKASHEVRFRTLLDGRSAVRADVLACRTT